jgi:hypothetical protein
MKLRTLLFTLALSPLALLADEASHRKAAEKVLTQTGSEKGLENTLPNFLEPTLQAMKRQGLPEDIVQDMKATVSAWFNKEIKYDEVKPKIVEVWMKNYTEQELNDLAKFFETDAGKKFLVKMPDVMRDSSLAVNEYMQSKQPALQSALEPLVARARAAQAAKGGSPAPGGVPTAPAVPAKKK